MKIIRAILPLSIKVKCAMCARIIKDIWEPAFSHWSVEMSGNKRRKWDLGNGRSNPYKNPQIGTPNDESTMACVLDMGRFNRNGGWEKWNAIVNNNEI